MTVTMSIVVGLIVVCAGAFIGYLAWLAKSIMDIRERVTRIEVNVGSLLETRTAEAVEDAANTKRRLSGLERKKPRSYTKSKP